MGSKEDLTGFVTKFFNMHWGFESNTPKWDFTWNWQGPVPNYLLGGVYALLRDDEVIYIGKGVSRGGGVSFP